MNVVFYRISRAKHLAEVILLSSVVLVSYSYA